MSHGFGFSDPGGGGGYAMMEPPHQVNMAGPSSIAHLDRGEGSSSDRTGNHSHKKRKTSKTKHVDGNESGAGSNADRNDRPGEQGQSGPREVKKRQPSCDVCRARKVKCVKQPGTARCDGCVTLAQRCEYTYERKKPGPANR